jgi:hypothetical protein
VVNVSATTSSDWKNPRSLPSKAAIAQSYASVYRRITAMNAPT